MDKSKNETVHEQVKAQFGKTAAAYVTSAGHAKGDELKLMVALAGELRERRVLDVATGGGHTALAFARAGAEVTATDLTPDMLRAAKAFIADAITNKDGALRFRLAPAEKLPFEDAAFEVVTCRIAAHHFADPQAFVKEAARVLVPGGMLMLVDNVAPISPELAEAMNRIERERDPSHVEAYSVPRWVAWLAGAGLEPVHLSRWETHKPFEAWLARAQTPEDAGRALETYVLGLPASFRDYFRVKAEGSRLVSLAHEAALLVARLGPVS